MTFETEEGYNRALNYKNVLKARPDETKDQRYWITDHEIDIKDACEPSDIIWENREITDSQRFFKGIIAFTVVSIMLAISFIIIVKLTQVSNYALEKYPPVPDCTNLIGYGDEEKM